MAEANREHEAGDAAKVWRWRYVFVAALVLGVVIDAFVSASEPPAEANPEPSYRHESLEKLATEIDNEDKRIERARRTAIEQNRSIQLTDLRKRAGATQKALAEEHDAARREELRVQLTSINREISELERPTPQAEQPDP